MEHLLNPRVKDIEISGIRTFSNLVSSYEDVVSLTIGQPDFIRRIMSKQLPKQPLTRISPRILITLDF